MGTLDMAAYAKFSKKFLGSAAFSKKQFVHDWLVQSVLVAGQPAVIGGPKKCMKSSVACDLAISLGTGTPSASRLWSSIESRSEASTTHRRVGRLARPDIVSVVAMKSVLKPCMADILCATVLPVQICHRSSHL